MSVAISIIMPVYNAKEYVSHAIKSVLDQTFDDFELIIIDDGSTDGSSGICDEFCQSDKRVRVIHQENAGICAARNKGLKMARGEYIGFIDNDDQWDKHTLEDNYKLLIKNNADWVKYGKNEILIKDNKVLKCTAAEFSDDIYYDNEIINNLLNMRCKDMMTFVWDSLFKRQNIVENDITFDEKFVSGNEDIDFCEEYAMVSKCLVINSRCYYDHNTRLGESASSKTSMKKIYSYLYLLSKSNRRYKNIFYNRVFPEKEYLYIITKQIIVNICQKVNDFGKLKTHKEKKNIIKSIARDNEFENYMKMSAINKSCGSLKLNIYMKLFCCEWFGLLLVVDNFSRKLMYSLRKLKR